MFEPDGSTDAPEADARDAAVVRLHAVLPARLPQVAEGPVARAAQIAPGVFRSAGRPPRRNGADESPEPTGPGAAGIDFGWTTMAGLVPGPGLAATLSEPAPADLSSFELIEAMAGWERLVAWAQGQQARVIAEFARRRPGPYAPDIKGRTVSEFAADEIAARLSMSRRAAEAKLCVAMQLADRLPGTLAALLAGRIDLAKVRAIADHTAVLSDVDHCRQVESRVLARAGSQTLPQLRRALARAVIALEPKASAKRHTRARADRCVRMQPCPDGMAEIIALLPAEDAMAVFNAVDAFASVTDPADPRGIDARRADALVDLCCGALTFDVLAPSKNHGDPSSVSRATRRHRNRAQGAQVQVTVSAGTLLGLDEAPAELVGYGPIPAEVARAMANDPDATWRRLLTDPASGILLDYGTTVYRPPPPLARHVKARDQTCQFPGCRQPAVRCDIDHRLPYPHGSTCADNLGSLCRHHHRAKTEGGWRWVRQEDGSIIWIAPTGHTYSADTPPALDIRPDADDDPCPF